MAKRFQTTYSNGRTDATSHGYEALNFQNYDDAQLFYLGGIKVTAVEFYDAARKAIDSAWEAKNVTHKRVRVLHGSSAGNYVEKWVRR